MPNGKKKINYLPTSEGVVFTVTKAADGTPLIKFEINIDKRVYSSALYRKINDGEEAIIASWVTGCTGGPYTDDSAGGVKSGSFLESYADCNPPLSYSQQPHPQPGDKVTYRFTASLGTISNHVIVYGAPITITL